VVLVTLFLTYNRESFENWRVVCSEWLYNVLLSLTEMTSSCRCTATRQRGLSSIGTSPLCQCHISLACYLLSSVIPSCLSLIVTCHSGSPVIHCYLSLCFACHSGHLSFCLSPVTHSVSSNIICLTLFHHIAIKSLILGTMYFL